LLNQCCDIRYAFAINLGGEIFMYLQLVGKITRPKKPVISTFPIIEAKVVLSAITRLRHQAKTFDIRTIFGFG
jgi:hypothetical protein